MPTSSDERPSGQPSGNVPDDALQDARGTYINPKAYRRPSERIFRRSRAAQARRAAKSKSDFKLIAALLQLSVLVALVLVGVGIYSQRAINGNAPDLSMLQPWTQPAFLGASWLEIGAIGLTLIAACIVYLRLSRRKR